MTIKKNLGFWLNLVATSLILAPSVQAKDISSEVVEPEQSQLQAGEFSVKLDGGLANKNLSELFNRAFYHNTGTFHDITGISGQINNIFGARTFPGSFLDNQIARDGKLVGTLYYYFQAQEFNKPTIRTQDAPNPFNRSIQDDPSYLGF